MLWRPLNGCQHHRPKDDLDAASTTHGNYHPMVHPNESHQTANSIFIHAKHADEDLIDIRTTKERQKGPRQQCSLDLQRSKTDHSPDVKQQVLLSDPPRKLGPAADHRRRRQQHGLVRRQQRIEN
ncbi:hypothetical protein TgHK011_005634 [Trichoderma gracile]|nr:hypothetical protein TgHK011_005634 [Trichoderma gracile]